MKTSARFAALAIPIALAATACATNTVTPQGARVVEIVTFDAQPTASDDQIVAALGPIEAKMGQYGTLVARSVAEGPDGKWTMINYWSDRDAMNRINQEALQWPEFGALPGVVNLETLQMQQLDIATTVNLNPN